jgi:hypothetical protein
LYVAAEREIVIRTQMTRGSTTMLAILFATATTVATSRRSAVAAERVAAKRAKTTVVEVHQPTVIVFAPPQWELDAKSDKGAVEMIAHVRFAVDDVNKCKGPNAITVRMVFADRLDLTLDGQHMAIDLSRTFPDSAGAYLLKSGKKPLAIATPKDTAGLGDILTRAVGGFFDILGCLHP